MTQRGLASNAGRYRSFGLSYDHVNKNGALVVAWTAEQLAKLPEIRHENHRVGDSEAVLLSRDELLEMEPTLSAHALGAVYVPRENVVEPWLVSGANADFAMRSLIWCRKRHRHRPALMHRCRSVSPRARGCMAPRSS